MSKRTSKEKNYNTNTKTKQTKALIVKSQNLNDLREPKRLNN